MADVNNSTGTLLFLLSDSLKYILNKILLWMMGGHFVNLNFSVI